MINPCPVAAVGVVCFRDSEVLLVRRGRPPLQGRWSLPGGRIEWGETAAEAALRELKEETACEARLLGLVDVVDAIFAADVCQAQSHHVLIDYAAHWLSGEPQAGDDAEAARFFAPQDLGALGLWEPTLRIIAQARELAIRRT